ncbi:MAG: RNA methyltransferase [Deltaproteobacteria bacterium]|nr:RNA methyltransferase [Deltaproteobacteria bacterium]
MIDDLADPRLAPFKDLRADRDRRGDPTFVCEGSFCIRRALEHRRFVVETVLATAAQLATLTPLLYDGVAVLEASNALIMELTGFKFHRGCLATVRKPALAAPDFSPLAGTPRSRVVFGEAVSNPSNVGSLIRNCRSFGVSMLVLDKSSADPFSRRAVRTAMGNVFALPLAIVDEVGPAIGAYRRATGAEVWAATLGDRSQRLDHQAAPAHAGLVVGTENTGLLPSTVAACSREVTIPMAEGADSLNVAAASAVLLYAMR